MGSLVKYVAIGGVACLGMASLCKVQINEKLRNASYFKEAIKLLDHHKASDLLLGKPVRIGHVDVLSKDNYADSKLAKMYVPVNGTKRNGTLFFSAVKNEEEDKWDVTRVELEITDTQGGTVLIFGNDSDKVDSIVDGDYFI